MVYVPIKCPICKSKDVKKHGKDPKGKQRYMCENSDCSKKVFLGEYTYKGCLLENKLKIIEMTLNGSGIRDTARVLEISPNTVLSELKKKNI
jgi:insertion element IS1 protein InsB